MEKDTDDYCVYVIDDDEAVRDSLCMLLDSVGHAAMRFTTPIDFLDVYTDHLKGCIVLDVRMPAMSGLELQSKLNEMNCILPIIFITGHGDVPMAVQAIKDGAMNFIQKPFRDQELLDLVNEAIHLDMMQHNQLKQQQDIINKIRTLTEREHEVLKFLVQGKVNKAIASDMQLSRRTVEIHRCRVMDKMGTKSLAHLVRQVMVVDPNCNL